jgi:hypothetical protein
MAAEGIDLAKGVARCVQCGTVFDLAGRKGPELGVTQLPVRPAPRVPMPKKFKVEEEPGLLRISWRWFSPVLILLTFFCLFWDSVLVLWYTLAIFARDTPIFFLVFPILHVMVGVGLTYRVIAGYFNTTRVEVTRRSLSIVHGPLPWKGNHTLEASGLKQLYCKQNVSKGKNDSETITYELKALTRDGQTLTLLDGLEEAQQALYLEDQLERRLGIENVPVPGELDRQQVLA